MAKEIWGVQNKILGVVKNKKAGKCQKKKVSASEENLRVSLFLFKFCNYNLGFVFYKNIINNRKSNLKNEYEINY